MHVNIVTPYSSNPPSPEAQAGVGNTVDQAVQTVAVNVILNLPLPPGELEAGEFELLQIFGAAPPITHNPFATENTPTQPAPPMSAEDIAALEHYDRTTPLPESLIPTGVNRY